MKENFLERNGLLLFIILCSISFFEIRFIPIQLLKALEFAGIGMMSGMLIINLVYGKGPGIKKNFTFEIGLILTSVVLSMFGAYVYHQQPFAITAVVQRYMYFFLFYFLLHQLRPEPNDLLRLIIYLGITYALIYFAQYFLYPTQILHSKTAQARGTVRIFFPGAIYLFLSLFLGLYLFFATHKYKYIAIVLAGVFVTILLGTRQVLIPIIFLIIMYILFSKKVKSKFAVFTLAALSLIPLYFMFEGIFISLLEVSKEQSQNAEDDIRIRAMKYYIFDFFPNSFSYIIGNGESSSNSIFGIKVNQVKEFFGYYQSDIGLIGDFSKFGLLYIVGQLVSMIRIVTWKLDEKMAFIKLMIWSMIITMATSGSFAGDPVGVCIMFYLVDTQVYIQSLSLNPEHIKIENNKRPDLRKA